MWETLKRHISWKTKLEADMTAMQLELRMLSAKVEQLDVLSARQRPEDGRAEEGRRRTRSRL